MHISGGGILHLARWLAKTNNKPIGGGHLRWKVDYPPSQPVGSGFEPHWRPQPAKLPSFGGYSLETLPNLTKTNNKPINLMSRLAVDPYS